MSNNQLEPQLLEPQLLTVGELFKNQTIYTVPPEFDTWNAFLAPSVLTRSYESSTCIRSRGCFLVCV